MKYKTFREVIVRKSIEEERELKQVPKFKIGQWAEIYNGTYEGSSFKIEDMRFNLDKNCFEYFSDDYVYVGWYNENRLT